MTKQSIVFSHANKNQTVINFIHKEEEKTQKKKAMTEEEEEHLEEEEVECRACEITQEHVNCFKHILDFILSLVNKLVKYIHFYHGWRFLFTIKLFIKVRCI